MNSIHYYNPAVLSALWLMPVMVALFIHSRQQSRKALQAFGAMDSFISRRREAMATSVAMTLIILALARPAWGTREDDLQRMGREVIFLLDVSRSMLANDLHPNRLEHAKTAILDCVEDLSGDRVGLVLFAGSAEIRCPLTVDYDYFRMALRQASPVSVSAGGTRIGNGIEKVIDQLVTPDKAGLQDLVLITDGEDMEEGPQEIEAARALGAAGVRLIAVGLGDRTRGSRIPETDAETGVTRFVQHDAREVWTTLQTETLRQMAAAVPEGLYFDVSTGPFDLRRIYRQVMDHVQRTVVETGTMERYQDKFHLFLRGSVFILLITHRWRKYSLLEPREG